jgi:acyl-CoA synthetase (AMP-forming)/AMP-acid ligase II
VPDWNLASVFESIRDATPDRPAIAQGDRRHSWASFDERASRFAAGLGALGVPPDAKVALYLYNGNEFLESMFGTLKARAVHVNVNYRYVEDELAYVLENADAEVLVFHGALGATVAAVRDRLPRLRAVIQVDDGSDRIDGALAYEELLAAHDPMPRIARSGDDLWFLYTGGTTGLPKGVMWRNEDLYGTLGGNSYPLFGERLPDGSDGAGAIAARVAATGSAPILIPGSPLMHGTGVMTSMQTLFLGGSVVTLEGRHFDPDELWRSVERERATQLAIVGDAFAKPMLRALEAAEARGRPYDLSSLNLIVSSGVIWSAEVKAALQARQPMVLLDSLGSSEGVGFGASITSPGEAAPTARFRAGSRTKVLTETGDDVEPGSGATGLLALGGYLPIGYYKDPDKSAATFKVFHGQRYSIPGDWAQIEVDGTITLLGRGSVCINSGGEKIYPEEVEEAVKRDPAVADCVAVGVPDERFGEAVTAVVAAEPGARVDADRLMTTSRGLARYKRPRHVVVVDQIKRGPNGKADYRWARDTATDQLGLPAR